MEQREARLDPRQRRPLAGCRLSRTPVTVDPSFLWPWPPSLPDSRRFGPPFGGLPVLRGHPTSPVPSSPRSFVLDDYRREPPAGGQEISPGKKKRRTSCEPVAFTRARRNGDRASALPAASTPRSHASSAFRLCSVPHCTVGLPSDPSSRMRPCLWWRVPSVQGPGRTSISSCRSSRHLLFCVHAGRTGRLRRRRCAAVAHSLRELASLDPPSALRGRGGCACAQRARRRRSSCSKSMR